MSSRIIMPLPTIMKIPNKYCRNGMVEPWRNTLAKSKQEHNAPSHNNENSEIFLCVGVAWWPPEEIPWPRRSRSKLPLSTIMTIKNGCRGGMVAPRRSTSCKSKQKHNAPTHNDNSKKIWPRVAWWHPDEIPCLSLSRIMPLPSIMTNPKNFGV